METESDERAGMRVMCEQRRVISWRGCGEEQSGDLVVRMTG
jgi:hypothetical protein